MEEAFWRTSLVRGMINERDFGGVLRLARQRFGLRQADIGRLAGYSASTVSRVENARRAGMDLDVLRAMADAVQMPTHVFARLLGLPAGEAVTVASPGSPASPAPREDPVLRRQLLASASLVPWAVLTGLDEALAVMPDPQRPASPGQLAARLARARRHYDGGHLGVLIAGLPDLLACAHAAADQNGGPAALATVAGVYDLATEALNKVGAGPQSRLTADRARTYATLSGDPIAMAAAARVLGVVLRHEGQHDLAQRVTLEAADQLDQAGLGTVGQAAAYAQMLCTGAYAAAQNDDRDRALELIREAQRAAGRLPEHPPVGRMRFPLNKPQIDLYEVGVHWALGDAGRALDAGRTLRPSMFPTAERRARLYTDMARAWWLRGRPEQTARQLLAAHHQSSAEVRDRPSIRAIATDLIQRHPRASGVRELATTLRAR